MITIWWLMTIQNPYPQIFESRSEKFRQEIGIEISDLGPSLKPQEPIKSELATLNRRFECLVDQIEERLRENGEKVLQEEGDSQPDIKVGSCFF